MGESGQPSLPQLGNTSIEKIQYVKATSENWNGLEDLFEASEECKQCWCMNHRFAPESTVTGNIAREALRTAIQAGTAQGILAFAEQQCVGWCAVDSIRSQPGHDYCLRSPSLLPEGDWSIHCLYVHPDFRGQGVSTGLIRNAVDLARRAGATQVLAFPIPEETRSNFPEHEAEFSGRLSSYLRLGFRMKARINDFYSVVGLDL